MRLVPGVTGTVTVGETALFAQTQNSANAGIPCLAPLREIVHDRAHASCRS